MNKSLDEYQLNFEKIPILLKKSKTCGQRQRRRLRYLTPEETKSKTFYLKYERPLSPLAKMILSSFQNKYLFFAIDDILHILKSRPMERQNILSILYSPVAYLQNNFCVNFFDIWIEKICIDEMSKSNKFLTENDSIFERFHCITITFHYTIKLPSQKLEPLW